MSNGRCPTVRDWTTIRGCSRKLLFGVSSSSCHFRRCESCISDEAAYASTFEFGCLIYQRPFFISEVNECFSPEARRSSPARCGSALLCHVSHGNIKDPLPRRSRHLKFPCNQFMESMLSLLMPFWRFWRHMNSGHHRQTSASRGEPIIC